MVDKIYLNKAVKHNNCRMKAAMDKMKMNGHGCIPTKLYEEKTKKKTKKDGGPDLTCGLQFANT